MNEKNSKILSPKDLRNFMNFHGISTKELAEIFGVTERAIEYWLTGKRELSVTNCRLIRIFHKYPQLLEEF
jgi:transcriptional regulator with XRE-family HTH domain